MRLDKDELSKTIGQRLKELRNTVSGLRQEDIAKEIGVTKQAVNSYENGRRIPDLPILLEFAKRYDCSMDYLFGLSDKPTREDKELSQEPYVQRLLNSMQKLSENDRAYLAESFSNLTDSLTLDRVNPRRREFVKPSGELITECAYYIEMTGEVAERIPKNATDSLTAEDVAESFAEFTNFKNRMVETCNEIWEIGVEALLHFSVKARKVLSRKAIVTDFVKAYRERNTTVDESDLPQDDK